MHDKLISRFGRYSTLTLTQLRKEARNLNAGDVDNIFRGTHFQGKTVEEVLEEVRLCAREWDVHVMPYVGAHYRGFRLERGSWDHLFIRKKLWFGNAYVMPYVAAH